MVNCGTNSFRFCAVLFGFCVTRVLATLKQPFRRAVLSRMAEFSIPKIELSNILSEWSAMLKIPLEAIPSADLIAEWTSSFRTPTAVPVIAEKTVVTSKRQRMSAPIAHSKRGGTRCVNSEAIIALEAVLLCLVPFAIGMEEIASPVALLEVIFFVVCSFGTKTRLDVPNEQHDRSDDRNWTLMWSNMLNSLEDPKQWLSSYFVDASFDELSEEDVRELLSWAMFTTTPSCLSVADEFAIARVQKQIEMHVQHTFPARAEGAPRFEVLRPSIESLRWAHKPLLFYAVTQGLFGALLAHRMQTNSFVRKTEGEISYWTNCDTSSSDKVPIVMVHGIGGLCAYFDFVKALLPLNSPMIVLEIPSISLHIAPNVPSIDAHVSSVESILNAHGIDKAVFMGHSFGSTVVSWVLQGIPERVAASVFMDPVVFMLHLTDILQSWTYKEPVNKLTLEGLMDVVKTELFASNTVQRHFCWHRNILFASELQESGTDTLVILSGADRIVPSDAVRSHIEEHNQSLGDQRSLVEALYLDDAPHGGIIFHDKFQAQAIDKIRQLVDASSSKHKSSRDRHRHGFKTKPSRSTRPVSQ